MAHQLLHVAQRRAAAQHVRGEGVAQRVRRHVVDAGFAGVVLEHQPDALAGQPLAAAVDEERLLAAPPRHPRARLIEVGVERRDGGGVDRDQPLAAALAHAAHRGALVVQLDRVQVERDELADAHAGRVEQLEHRLVALGFGGVLARGLLKQRVDLIDRQRVRQRPPDARRGHLLGRVVLDHALRLEVGEEALHRGDFARHRRLGVLLVAQIGDVLEQFVLADAGDVLPLRLDRGAGVGGAVGPPSRLGREQIGVLDEERAKLREVVAVSRDRVVRRPLLGRHVAQELADLALHLLRRTFRDRGHLPALQT